MPGYSGMRPRRLRPMIVGVPPRVGAVYAGIGRRNCGSMFGVKYFCRSTSTILAGSDGCSFDDAPFAGRCCGF